MTNIRFIIHKHTKNVSSKVLNVQNNKSPWDPTGCKIGYIKSEFMSNDQNVLFQNQKL